MKNKPFLKAIRCIGSNFDVATLLGYSESHIRAIICGAKNVPAQAVLKLVDLCDGKVAAKELRPDIFNA